MNINPDKVKKLILIFSELDEEYQDKLMKEAYKLELLQKQDRKLKQEKKTFKSQDEHDKEVEKRAVETCKDIKHILDMMKNMDDTDKASIFMLANQLAGDGNVVKESDISIMVNQREIPMKEYLDKHMLNADYDEAKEKVVDFMKGLQNK